MALAKERELLPLGLDAVTDRVPAPAPHRRRRRFGQRLGALVTACAMGSWVVLAVVPVLVLLSWLTRITHL